MRKPERREKGRMKKRAKGSEENRKKGSIRENVKGGQKVRGKKKRGKTEESKRKRIRDNGKGQSHNIHRVSVNCRVKFRVLGLGNFQTCPCPLCYGKVYEVIKSKRVLPLRRINILCNDPFHTLCNCDGNFADL